MAHGEPPNNGFFSTGYFQPFQTNAAAPEATLTWTGPPKPPLGAVPRGIHREQRRAELLRAISEYVGDGHVNESNRATVLEWIDELREMVEAQ